MVLALVDMRIPEPVVDHFFLHSGHYFDQLPSDLDKGVMHRLASLGTCLKPFYFFPLQKMFLLAFDALGVLITFVTDGKYLDIILAVGSNFLEPYFFDLFKRFRFMNIKY